MAEEEDDSSLSRARRALDDYLKNLKKDEEVQQLLDLEKLNITDETVEAHDDDDEYDDDEYDDEEYEDSSDDDISWNGHPDEYEDSDDEGFVPKIVMKEIRRREKLENCNDEPPNETVVAALRAHFLSDRFDDDTIYCRGGFIDWMTQVGAVPSAKDPLVYDVVYNLDQEDQEDKFRRLQHDSRVRLIRYKELIDELSVKGIKAGEDWVLQAPFDDGYDGGCDSCEEYLNVEQIMAFGRAMSYGWYYYLNFDNLFVGRGVGVSKVQSNSQMPGGFKDMEMDVDEDIMINQCIDLARMYEELKCPLGPEAVFKAEREGAGGGRNRKGKKNRGKDKQKKTEGWGSKPHSEEIRTYLSDLLETIGKHLLPTDATGAFVFHVAEMLEVASQYDPAIAHALINRGESRCGDLVMILSLRASKYAEEANSSSKERIWRQASSALMGTLCYSVKTCFTKHAGNDEAIEVVTNFFFKKILPQLVTGVEASVSQVRSSALENLLHVLSTAPPTVLMRFLEKKGSWARIESACRASLDDCVKLSDELKPVDKKSSAAWMNHMKHVTLTKAADLLECLSARSFQLQDHEEVGDAITVVAPTALTDKMIKRGAIPLLMDIAKADLGPPSNKAMESLGTLSRVKDCRTIMLQDEGGLTLVKRGFSTKDAGMFAATILLVLHLLWDEEWAEPISSIEPGVTLTTIRWGLFAMNSIIARAEDRKEEKKKITDKIIDLQMDEWDMEEGDEKERVRRERLELQMMIPKCEFDLDENGQCVTKLDRLLLRCCLLMQVVNKIEGGNNQLVQCGGLSFLSACIDIPAQDTQRAVVTAVRNAFITIGPKGIVPSNFSDPAHFVRALLEQCIHLMDSDPHLNILMSQTAGRLKAQSVWDPYFKQLPADLQFIGQIIPPIDDGPSERPKTRILDPINISSAALTGKLRTCGGCGKLEAKRGSFSKCSACYEILYCSREVRTACPLFFTLFPFSRTIYSSYFLLSLAVSKETLEKT
jgi:hypothetical protein